MLSVDKWCDGAGLLKLQLLDILRRAGKGRKECLCLPVVRGF